MAQKRQRCPSTIKPITLAIITSLTSLALAAPPAPTELPSGGSVAAGSAAISQSAANLTINQSSSKAIINWNTFNIGSQASVAFNQPSASSVTLNRVLASDPSAIYGRLSANGQIFLVNPAGIVFGAGSSVNTAGIVASTLNITDQNFMSGNYRFERNGSTGAILNQGTLTSNGGYVALLAPEVRNEGVILANLGTVALAAGEAVTLTFDAANQLKVAVDPSTLKTLIENRHIIQANGGTVLMASSAAADVLGSVIRNTGVIEANSIGSINGEVVLYAANGTTMLEGGGRIEARGLLDGQNGGTVKLLGNQVGMLDSSSIDVSGAAGGGTVLVGGNFHGAGPEANASATYMAPGASINADATASGNGGNVALWSNDSTQFYGGISARGGAAAGNGGFVETSSENILIAAGNVNAGAPNGLGGVWLLDPNNISIQANGGINQNVTPVGSTFNSNNDSSIVDNGVLGAAISNGTTVNVQTTSSGTNSQNGDITVQDPVTAALSAGQSATLNLNAQGNISFTATGSISSATGKLNVNLNAGMDATFVTAGTKLSSIIMANGSSITTGGGNVTATAKISTGISNGISLAGINTGAGDLTVTSTGAGGLIQNISGLTIGGVSTINAGANQINLSIGNTFTGAVSLNNTGNNVASLTNNTATILGTSSVGSSTFGVSSTGPITQTGALTLQAGGVATFNAGANTITLTNPGNNFPQVTLFNSGANDVAVTNNNALVMGFGGGNINVGRNLTVVTNGALTQAGIFSVAGNTSVNVGANTINLPLSNKMIGAVSLNNSGANNVLLFNNRATVLDTSSVGTGTLTVTSNGAITQTGALTQAAGASTATFNAGANAITLTNALNDFTGAVSLNNSGAGNVAITDANALILGTSTFGGTGTLTVISNGAITQTGPLTGPNLSVVSFSAGANPITLTNAGNNVQFVDVSNSGANDVAVTAATSFFLEGAIGGNLNVVATPPTPGTIGLQLFGNLTVGGTTTVNVGANSILMSQGFINTLTGAVSLNNTGANEVTLTNNVATVLGTSTVGSGKLTVTSNGAITQTGALTQQAGTGTATFNAGANAIALTNAGNDFTGAVTLTNSGANNVAVTDTNALSLAGGTFGGNLAVIANGAVTQNAGLRVAGTTSINAGAGSITLGGNNFLTGAVSLNNTGANNVLLANNVSTVLGKSAVGSGTLVVSVGGNITQAGALTQNAAGAGTATFSGDAITLTNGGNDFTGVVALNNHGGGAVALTDVNALSAVLNTTGTTSLIAGTAMTVSGTAVGVNGNAGTTMTVAATGLNGGAGPVQLVSTGDLTLNGVVSSTASGNSVTLATTAGNFINNAGANAISVPAAGRFLVYSGSPQLDTLGGLTASNTSYGTKFGDAIPFEGSGFLYRFASTIDLPPVTVIVNPVPSDNNPGDPKPSGPSVVMQPPVPSDLAGASDPVFIVDTLRVGAVITSTAPSASNADLTTANTTAGTSSADSASAQTSAGTSSAVTAVSGIDAAASLLKLEEDESARRNARKALYKTSIEVLRTNPTVADIPLCGPGVSEVCMPAKPGIVTDAALGPVNLRIPATDVRKKVAILIGNNDYRGDIPRLETPVSDVAAIGRVLQDRLGYEVTLVPNATKATMVRILKSLSEQSSQDESVLIFYAGHGYQLEDSKAGFWIPTDANPGDPKTWLSNNDVQRFLNRIDAKQIVVVSDSCFSGTLTKEQSVDAPRNAPREQLLSRRAVVTMSSGGEEPVTDEGVGRHSIFAYHFMDEMQKIQKMSPVSAAFEKLREKVAKSYPQTPQLGAVLSAGHMAGATYLFEAK